MANGSEQAYAAYRIEIETNGKGQGISARKRVQALFNSLGVPVHIDSDVRDKRTSLMIEVLDGEDFNASNIRHCLEDVARVRSIVPVPDVKPKNGESEITELQKQVDDYKGQMEGYESAVRELTNSLAQRQRVIDGCKREIGDLEERLKKARPQQFSSALSAVLEGYLPESLDMILELDEDWRSLSEDGHSNVFIDSRDSASNGYLGYIAKVYGREFGTEAELRDWLEALGIERWEDTSKGRELSKRIDQRRVHKELYETARNSGASEEVLEALRKAACHDEGLERQVHEEKELFKKDKEIKELIEGSRERYDRFRQIAGRVKERGSTKSLPIVLHTGQGFDFYVPSIDSNSLFEEHLRNSLSISLNSIGKYTLGKAERDAEGFVKIPIKMEYETSGYGGELLTKTDKIEEELIKDGVLKSLGVRPKIIVLRD